MNESAVISFDRVNKGFFGTSRVFDGFNLRIEAGEVVCIVGKSGCGKTTLLNLASGIEAPDGGAVTLSTPLAYAAQRDMLLSWRTVLQNVLMPLELAGAVSAADIDTAMQLMQQVELKGHEHKFPHELSGGMRQKASLLRALIQDRELYLFDEPFSAVDYDARLRLTRALRTLLKTRHKTALFVTHNIEEAISLGDRIVVLRGLPAQAVLDSRIQIADDLRDPVALRKTGQFQQLFETVWRAASDETI